MRHNKNIDKQLREIIKKEVPTAPENPWFVRKVLNQLPERMRYRQAAIFIAVLYAIVVAALIFGWLYAVNDTMANGLSTTTIILAIALPITTLIAIGMVMIPAIRR